MIALDLALAARLPAHFVEQDAGDNRYGADQQGRSKQEIFFHVLPVRMIRESVSYRAKRVKSTTGTSCIHRSQARIRRCRSALVGFSWRVVDIAMHAAAARLNARLPLMASGRKRRLNMKRDAFRTAATWFAAMFVGTMFVAASTSFAGLV